MPPPRIPKALIPIKDKHILSPIEKHIYYRRFPYKLIFHLLLVVLTTVQVFVVIDSEFARHSREQFRLFKYILLDSTESVNYQSFMTIDDFKDHLRNLIESFRTMNDLIYQNYDDSQAEFSIGIYYTVASEHHRQGVTEMFPVDLDSGTLGPINPEDTQSLRYWIRVSSYAEFQAANLRTIVKTSKNTMACMDWNISIAYNFEISSQINAHIKTSNRYCSKENEMKEDFKKGNFMVNIVSLIASTISIILSLRHIYKITNLYMTTKFNYSGIQEKKEYKNLIKKDNPIFLDDSEEDNLKKFLEKNIPWHALPFSQRLRFFNFWVIFGTIGNAIQIVGSISVLLTLRRNVGQEILTRDNIFIGFGCFFAWVQMLYYLHYSQNIVLLTSTIRKSLTENLAFFGFVAPLFIGFTFLSQALFYQYDRFETPGNAMRTLISMACGGVVFDVFDETVDAGLMRQMFLFLFFILFFTSIQNIFVAIIMEGYDRCSIRKEIDNDDPFPNQTSVKPLKKRKTSRDADSNLNQTELEPLNMTLIKAHSAVDLDAVDANGETPSWVFVEENDKLKLLIKKIENNRDKLLKRLEEVTQAYSGMDDIPFGKDDILYLRNLYHESLRKLLVKMKRYQSMFDTRTRSF